MTSDPQLEMFKGRAKRRLGAKEFALQCVFADIVRRWISKDWKFTHLPMGEHRSKATAARLKRMGVTAGWPDFVFVGPACVFWLELKRESGKLSEEQRDMRGHLMRCGFPYLVTSSVNDAVTTLQDYNILPRGIRVQ